MAFQSPSIRRSGMSLRQKTMLSCPALENPHSVLGDRSHAARVYDRLRARTVQKEDRRRSGSCALVIVEHSTEALAPLHRLRWRYDRGGPQKLVCEALRIAFSMV